MAGNLLRRDNGFLYGRIGRQLAKFADLHILDALNVFDVPDDSGASLYVVDKPSLAVHRHNGNALAGNDTAIFKNAPAGHDELVHLTDALFLFLGALEAAVIATCFNTWDFFVLMTVAFAFFNLIPLGAGIIAYPIIIVGMVLGAFWPGVVALVLISIVSNLESFLRPKFIPKSITLTNGLTMLAAFGGISLFGLLGVVYGPIIMIIVVTSIQMYLDYYDDLPKWRQKANKA
jgi:hypothetical protein